MKEGTIRVLGRVGRGSGGRTGLAAWVEENMGAVLDRARADWFGGRGRGVVAREAER